MAWANSHSNTLEFLNFLPNLFIAVRQAFELPFTKRYNTKGNLTQRTDAFGSAWAYTYDLNGNVATEVDPKGQTKSFVYDSLNRLNQVTFPDDQVTYTYDDRGDIVRAANSTSVIVNSRNSKGWLLSTSIVGTGTTSQYPPLTIANSYDEAGNLRGQSSAVGIGELTI
ncbi:MAG: RHS repeat protein [Bdellovibrionaceae bacterium]|nr:RHS repeat protein [Pseudobdellovibrionaceae bacterium]